MKLLNTYAKKVTAAILAIVLLCALTVSGIVIGCELSKKPPAPLPPFAIPQNVRAKNVVFMIGDGMGPNHLEATCAYYDIPSLYMEDYATAKGYATTHSADNAVTDSAAAGTALSTGHKTNNGSIATKEGELLQNMSEYAITQGKVVGIVATEAVTGATPATFSAHATDRDDENDIIASQMQSGVSLFMGAGKGSCDLRAESIRNRGYTYVNTDKALTDELMSADKIFAAFSSVDPYGKDTDNNPNLAEASLFALNYLDQKSENGFFAMIEASHIDKRSHNKKMTDMVAELRGFDEAIKAVVEWANEKGDTLVIVTADHETGNLTGASRTEDTIGKFQSSSHTGQNVYVFAYHPTATFMDGYTIDNTDISKIVRQYLLATPPSP